MQVSNNDCEDHTAAGESCLELPLYGRLCKAMIRETSQPLLQLDTPAGLEHLISDPEYEEEAERINNQLRRCSPRLCSPEWWARTPPLPLMLVWGAAAAFLVDTVLADQSLVLWLGTALAVVLVLLPAMGPTALRWLRAWRAGTRQQAVAAVLADINGRWACRGLRWEQRRGSSFITVCQSPFTLH